MRRELDDAIARTITGFLNCAGGSLLIGAADQGTLRGLGRDYQTRRDGDRDGFERIIIGLVRARIGGDACPRVHVSFHLYQERDIDAMEHAARRFSARSFKSRAVRMGARRDTP